MKLRLVLLIFLILAGGWRPAFAQYLGSGTITAAGTTCTPTTCVSVGLFQDTGAVSFTISGTWSATLQFEVSEDNTNFVALNAYPPNSTTAVTSTAANGTWTAGVAGMVQFRVRASAYSSGTATVSIQGSKAVALSSLTGGGGSGSVASVSGTANQIDSTGGAQPRSFTRCSNSPSWNTNWHIAERSLLGLQLQLVRCLLGHPRSAHGSGERKCVGYNEWLLRCDSGMFGQSVRQSEQRCGRKRSG